MLGWVLVTINLQFYIYFSFKLELNFHLKKHTFKCQTPLHDLFTILFKLFPKVKVLHHTTLCFEWLLHILVAHI